METMPAREYSSMADHVANCALDEKEDVDTLSLGSVREALSKSIGLQIFTDGGFMCGPISIEIAVSFTIAWYILDIDPPQRAAWVMVTEYERKLLLWRTWVNLFFVPATLCAHAFVVIAFGDVVCLF